MKFVSTINTSDIRVCPFCGKKFAKSHQWNQWNRHVHIEAENRRKKKERDDPEWRSSESDEDDDENHHCKTKLKGGRDCTPKKRKHDYSSDEYNDDEYKTRKSKKNRKYHKHSQHNESEAETSDEEESCISDDESIVSYNTDSGITDRELTIQPKSNSGPPNIQQTPTKTFDTLKLKNCPVCKIKFSDDPHKWNAWNRHVHIFTHHQDAHEKSLIEDTESFTDYSESFIDDNETINEDKDLTDSDSDCSIYSTDSKMGKAVLRSKRRSTTSVQSKKPVSKSPAKSKSPSKKSGISRTARARLQYDDDDDAESYKSCLDEDEIMSNDEGEGEDDKEYFVEKIVNFEPNYKGSNEARFEVKWKGYSKTTWESWKNCENSYELIIKYFTETELRRNKK